MCGRPPTQELDAKRLTMLVTGLQRPLPTLAECLEATTQQTLAMYVLPFMLDRSRRPQLATQMQRRTKVVRIFPTTLSLALGRGSRSNATNSGWNAVPEPGGTRANRRQDARADQISLTFPTSGERFYTQLCT